MRPAIITSVLLLNSPFPLLMSVSLIASLSRRPAIVVNSAILNSLEIVIGAWLRFYPNK